MRFTAKSAATVTLLFCFLSVNFHNIIHFRCHHKGVESNFPDTSENEQHNISMECDECLKKDKNPYNLNFSNISYFVYSYTYACGFENYIGYSLPLYLHSRAPPKVTI